MKIAYISDFLQKPLLFFFTFLVFILAFSCEAFGDDLCLNDQKLYDYATHLYLQGEYYRSVTEYNRFLYFFPDNPLHSSAELQIGKAYMAGDRLDEAIAFWKSQMEGADKGDENFSRIKILLGISLLDLDQSAIFSFRKNNIEEAIQNFNELDERSNEIQPITDFADEWQSAEFPGMKSPLLAGSLSAVLPGAGSLYTGRYLEGIYAFFITGLFYLATVDAVSNDEAELGYLFGFLTLGFYGGNIYAAANGAFKMNDQGQAETLKRLRQKHGIWFIPATENHPGRY